MADTISLGLEIILILLAVAWLIGWVMTLIHQAKRGRYNWLACTALVQVILIIYWIVYLVNPTFKERRKIA